MSRVDELIHELCPEGVRYHSITEFAECLVGGTPATGNPLFWDEGTIPWMKSGEVNKSIIYETENRITQLGYDACSARLVPAGSVVIALAGQGKTRGLVARTRIELSTNQSLCAITPNESMNSDFLYFFLATQYQRLRELSSGDGSRGGLNLSMIRNYRVPVPPLEVQREIVRVLDLFQSLEAELEAELEARRRQYAHYRDWLLDFTERGGVRWMTLGEAAFSERGSPMTLKQTQPGQVRVVANGPSVVYFHDQPNRDGQTVVVARSGANAGTVSFWEGPIFLTDAFSLRPKSDVLTHRFLYYSLLVRQNHIRGTKKGAGVPHVRVSAIEQLKIPVPPLDEQKRIVEILDDFALLVNDISIGLPAELAARRSQYEYYRDRLLTFEEAA
jgi:type I restriction enzyme S subunit